MSWIDACAADDVDPEDVIEVDAGGRALCIYRSPDDAYFASDALCTHERAPLADGLVMGHAIECPKHNGRFDYRTGEAIRIPCREPLTTYPARIDGGRVLVELPD